MLTWSILTVYQSRNLAAWKAHRQHVHCNTYSRLQCTHTHIFVRYYQHYTTQSRKRPKAFNFFGIICPIVTAWVWVESLLRKKDHAEQLPLCHGVVFLLFWLNRGIMDLRLDNNGTTLLCFYCNKAINWRNTQSVKLKW